MTTSTPYAIGTMYMDIIQECEKLGDYVVNVVEARMGVKQQGAVGKGIRFLS